MTKKTPLDIKVAIYTSAVLGVDSIIFPFISGGKTLHEYVGLPPDMSQKILGERTLMMVEQALWGVSNLYYYIRQHYSNKR